MRTILFAIIMMSISACSNTPPNSQKDGGLLTTLKEINSGYYDQQIQIKKIQVETLHKQQKDKQAAHNETLEKRQQLQIKENQLRPTVKETQQNIQQLQQEVTELNKKLKALTVQKRKIQQNVYQIGKQTNKLPTPAKDAVHLKKWTAERDRLRKQLQLLLGY